MIPYGSVAGARGGTVEAVLPGACVGDAVALLGRPESSGHVYALSGERAIVALHSAPDGIARGTTIRVDLRGGALALGTCALGRSIDARGRPLDGGAPLAGPRIRVPCGTLAPSERGAIRAVCWTGIRTIDGLLTMGRGARVGVFGAPGTGKSTLIEGIAAGCQADAVVVALVGERGREAERWIARREAHATVVCATSDRPPAERVRCANVALAHAAALRARGLHVLLVVDSLARIAAALRELAIAAGEPPGRGGFPPSVFADLARMVEAAGAARTGAVTLVASVLDDGEDRDPVTDAARSLLDGHVVLATRFAERGRFPAIDVLASASRTMAAVATAAHQNAALRVRRALGLIERSEDARRVGLQPIDAASQRAVACEAELDRFLSQGSGAAEPQTTLEALQGLAARFD